MVSCSHTFVKINLKNTKICRINLVTKYNMDTISKRNKTPEQRWKDGEVEINNTLGIYACCMNKSYWALILKFKTENHHHNFLNMSLHSFTKILYMGKNSRGKELIKSINLINSS